MHAKFPPWPLKIATPLMPIRSSAATCASIQLRNARLLKDVLWLLAVMTACGVVALAISTALGVPAR